VFWLAGAVLLAFGIWMKVDPTIVKNLDFLNVSGASPLVSHAATIFIIGGAFIFVIGFLGCCGAIKEQQALLFLYAALIIVIMAVEITAAVLVLVYRTNVEAVLQKEMLNEVKNKYMPDTATKDGWDFLQKQMKCCGANSYEDYHGSKWYNTTVGKPGHTEVPESCCLTEGSTIVNKTECMHETIPMVTPKKYLNQQNCYNAIMTWFKTHTMIMMIIGFVVAALEIFGLLAACCLRSALKNPEGKAA